MSVQSVSGTWVSDITVLNPSNSPGAADITVNFYDASGNQIPSATVTQTGVAPGGVASWYVPNIAGLSANQTYSAVVSASQQVYATVNLSTSPGTNPEMGETYNGVDVSTVASSASVPSVLRNYHGFTSNLVVQNTGSTTVTPSVSFTGNNGISNFVFNGTPLAANASETIDLANITNLGDNFAGAATVNGGGANVAVVANDYTPSAVQTGDASSPNITGYLFSSGNAFAPTSGSATVYAPGLYKGYHGFFSALTIQNVDTVATTVTATYSGQGISGVAQQCALSPGQSCLLFTPNVPGLPSSWIGSAAVTSTGQKIVATVNISSYSGPSYPTSPGGSASYNAFGSGFLNVFAPGLLSNYHGFSSSLTIQNVDSVDAPPGSITVNYSNINHSVTNPDLPPGQAWAIYLPNDPAIPANYNGGATVTSTTAHVVGVESISGAPFSDELFSTGGFGQ
jgi:hypothetical protein